MKAPTFKDHIRELRNRLMIVAAVFLAASSAAYYFRDSLIHALLNPIHGESLVYLTPGGGFNFIFLVSIYAGLSVSIPLILYQLYSFIRPTLPASSQKLGMRIFFLSILLMVSGILFAYVYAIPGALKFLYGFAESYVEASLTAESYLNFIVGYVLGLGAVFQLPLLLFIIHKIKPLTPIGLLKSERWVIVLAFVAAALITPTPDPMNQTIIAMPIILMYQFGVFAILYSLRKEKKAAKKAIRARPITAQPALQNRLPQPAPEKTVAPAMMDIRQPAHQTVNTMSPVMPSAIKRPAPRLINDMRPVRPTRPQNLVQQRSIQRPTLTQATRPAPRVQTRPMSIQQPSSGVHPLLLRKQLSL